MRPVKLFFSGEAIAQAQAILDGSGDPSGLAQETAEAVLNDGTMVKMTLMAPNTDGSITADIRIQVGGTGWTYSAGTRIEPGGNALTNIDVPVPKADTFELQICTTEVSVAVPAAQADDAEALLEGTAVDDSKSGTQLLKLTGVFGGGYEADITLVQSGEDEAPWIDASLFLEGDEVMTLEPCEGPLLDDYPFEHDGRTFTLTLVRGQEAAAIRPAPRPRRPGAHGTWI